MNKIKTGTMFESILENEQMDSVYDNIITDLTDNELDQDQISSALLATTSMGFNDLFNILTRMIVNAYVLDRYNASDDNVIKKDVQSMSTQTINIIKSIGESIVNDKIQKLTGELNVFMEEQQKLAEAAVAEMPNPEIIETEVVDEGTTDSEVDEDSAEDLS